jgi:hypothetical protein
MALDSIRFRDDVQLDDVFERAERYVAWYRAANPKDGKFEFIRQPQTWLRNRGYEDVIPEPPTDPPMSGARDDVPRWYQEVAEGAS